MSLSVIKYGTKVKTVIGCIPAIITGILISENNAVEYRLCYFNNGVRELCWVDRIEFEIDESPKKEKAGLVNYDQPTDNEDKIQFLL